MKILIDPEDRWILKKWSWKIYKGYVWRHTHIKVDGKRKAVNIYMARQIMNAPKGMVVDHINRNPLDNRKKIFGL